MREPNKKRTHINYLRKFRRARGLKCKDVNEILGLRSRSTLARWERGVALPSPLNLLRLAALYRTFVDALYPDIASDLKSDLEKQEQRARNVARALASIPRRIDIESMRIKSKIESISKRKEGA